MKQAENFNKLNKGIRVEIIIGNQEKMKTMLAAGVPPDILAMSDFAYLGRQGWFVDIRPLLVRDNLWKNFNPTMMNAMAQDNGAIYVVPWFINAGAAFFNRDMFNASGLISPDRMGKSWTWDAMITAGKKLTTDADGNGIPEKFGIDRPWGYWGTAVAQAGGAFYEFNKDEQPIRSLWMSPEVKRGIEYTLSMYTEGITPHKWHLSKALNQVDYYFWNGKSAIDVTDGLGILDAYLSKAPFDWDFSLQPIGPVGPINHVDNTIGGLNILTTCKNIDAAWEWMKYYVMDRDRMIDFARSVGVIPALLSAQPVYPEIKNLSNKNFSAVLEQSSFPPKKKLYSVDTFLVPRFVSFDAVWSGQKPVETQLQEVHDKMTAYINEKLAANSAQKK
jgi:ABC-type glycerol-3-phosphate transport system substrate-binding protein